MGVDNETDFGVRTDLDDGRRVSAIALGHAHFLGFEFRSVDRRGGNGFRGSKREERISVRNIEQRERENDYAREFEEPLGRFSLEKRGESADAEESGCGSQGEKRHGHSAHHETAGAYGVHLHGEREPARQEERERAGGHGTHGAGSVRAEVLSEELRKRHRNVAQAGGKTGEAESEKEHKRTHGDRYEADEEIGKPDERAERAQKAAEKSKPENASEIEEYVRFESGPSALFGVPGVPFRADAENEPAHEGHAARNARGEADEKGDRKRGGRQVSDFSKGESEMPREIIEREYRECRDEYEFVFRCVGLEPGEVFLISEGIPVFRDGGFYGVPIGSRFPVAYFYSAFRLAGRDFFDAVEVSNRFFKQDLAGLAVHSRNGDGMFAHGKKR